MAVLKPYLYVLFNYYLGIVALYTLDLTLINRDTESTGWPELGTAVQIVSI